MGKYYELEEPVVISSTKNVVKIYTNHGKIQVFPRVKNSRHGIGKGATIDLEVMASKDIELLRDLINQAVDKQVFGEANITNEIEH